MKKIFLSYWIFVVFVGNVFGADETEEVENYAHKLCEQSKQQMVETGVLSPEERRAFDEQGIKIFADFNEAVKTGNEEVIKSCQAAFHTYVNRFVTLSEQAQELKKD